MYLVTKNEVWKSLDGGVKWTSLAASLSWGGTSARCQFGYTLIPDIYNAYTIVLIGGYNGGIINI